jgi:aspartyl-tRNA(Asn)/glutamyl-tRNA(Gln) amidotransferase subunit A
MHVVKQWPTRQGASRTNGRRCLASASSHHSRSSHIHHGDDDAYGTISAIRAGETSATEVMRLCLERIAARDGALRSFLHVNDADALLEKAAAIDRMAVKPPLAGLPVAVKDNLCTSCSPTTAGSRALRGYRASFDATAVANLVRQGAIVVGKTNMDEFGMGSSTENSAYQVTVNPWDPERVPGGSSGGSAAAVGAGLVPAAIGSDTGGSIRQPAHFCGIVGLKPTYGSVSRRGLVSYGSSLDVVGPMARSVRDAALLFEHMSSRGPDRDDMTQKSLVSFELRPTEQLEGVRVGLIEETVGAGLGSDVSDVLQDSVRRLESLGATVAPVSFPSFRYGLSAYYVLALSEASSNLSRYDGIRYGAGREAFGPEVKRRILMGTYALSAGYYDAYYRRAQQVRTLVTREMESSLRGDFDLLLSPVAPHVAFKIGEKTRDPLEMYKGDLMTVNVNLSGLPAISVPAGVRGSLPVGIQLIGRPFDEATLLRVADVFFRTNGDT